MAEEAKKVSVKLLIDKKKDVVLFAEAGKDFVDFLFHILALPLGTVIRLLKKNEMVGSLGKLYDSVEVLSETYCIQPSSGTSSVKDSLLKPKTPRYYGNVSSDVPLLLPPGMVSYDDSNKTYYSCEIIVHNTLIKVAYCSTDVTEIMETVVAGSGSGGGDITGYVKGVVTYMVMDDLTVKPMSTISSITLLNQFNVMDLKQLEEKVIEFGMDQGVALLEASLHSESVLTDIFLNGKKKISQ